jgi:hypothetical protein
MSQFSGTSAIDTAKKCFAENLRNFGNSQNSPEEYNLYNGLANLAIAVEQMQSQIAEIQQLISTIANQR